jgi:hypothetical protein
MTGRAVIAWLRRLNRGYQFIFVAIAAWSPLLLAMHPWLAGVVMSLSTALFFIATHSSNAVPPVPPSDIPHDS